MKYILSLVLSLFLLFSCQKSEKSKTSIEEYLVGSPDQLCINFDMKVIDSGKVRTYIKSGRARIYNDTKKTYLDSGVYVEFFNKTTYQRDGWLKSDSAMIDDATGDMTAYGRVKVVSDSSVTTINTSELNWSKTTEKLYSDKYVEINSPYEEINGYGFESNQDLSNYVIYKVSGKRK